MVGTAPSVTLELVNVCKALPDFGTLWIVHFFVQSPYPLLPPVDGGARAGGLLVLEQHRQVRREQVRSIRDLAIDCLNGSETGCQGGPRKEEDRGEGH